MYLYTHTRKTEVTGKANFRLFAANRNRERKSATINGNRRLRFAYAPCVSNKKTSLLKLTL
jgi:hypothetical protein